MIQESYRSMNETFAKIEERYSKAGLFEDNKELELAITRQASQLDAISKNNTTITRNLRTIQDKVSDVELADIQDSFNELSKIVN